MVTVYNYKFVMPLTLFFGVQKNGAKITKICIKMTERFRCSFLKFIYNNQKKELGWRRKLREF